MDTDRPTALLARVERTLPASDYWDPDHYRRELDAIWFRSWLCVARAENLARPRDFAVVEVGDQSILLCRDLEGGLRAFHNSCRHRGSLLCTERTGRLRGGSIVCPYHGWTYSLAGELLGARHQLAQPDFDRADYPLHAVAIDEWAGFVFVNLAADAAPPLADALGDAPGRLASWRIDALRVGHHLEQTLACNWKVFWENFSECFHCPGVHPELCQLVPTYAQGLIDAGDSPDAAPGAAGAPLAPGARTWTLDGASDLPSLPGLDAEEQARGQTFGVLLPTMFVVGHPDYVRSVRMLPRGPEHTELVIEWLFEPATLEREDFDLERSVALGRRVVEQDARVCEINQRGLHSRRHERGVLVAQEYGVFEFQQWVRQALATQPPAA
jgi:Rieske 2Fe-2S family protein